MTELKVNIELKTAIQESTTIKIMHIKIKISVMKTTNQRQPTFDQLRSTTGNFQPVLLGSKKGGVINPPNRTVKSTPLPDKNPKQQSFIHSPITKHNKYDVTTQRNHVTTELR